MATMLDNLHVRKTKSNHELFHKEKTNMLKEARAFGEMAVVKVCNAHMQSKILNKGMVVMLLGFAE